MKLSTQQMEANIVRYGDLQPCKTAFIDAHTPGSDLKENFTIIGAGVTESPHQHVHIKSTPGFNIGAAGQPPKCKNSMHTHTTAEVFFVLSGRWRFFWGRYGTAGEFIANEGDIFNIPTGVFRGFENVGTDYGMIMSILGGDDSGGGVTWAPHVIEEARVHGLLLGENGVVYDTKIGESLPEGIAPMPSLSEEEMKAFPEPPVQAVVRDYVARYWDLMALAKDAPAKVIGEQALLKDRPGFEVEFLTRGSIPNTPYTIKRHEILMVIRGRWKLGWNDGSTQLAPGDVCAVPPGLEHRLETSMTGEASLYRVIGTDDPAGPTWQG
jgi:mannose-6-phosphate isomerase-like protein (cupin superfamily)